MLISIVTPVLNGAKTIERTLRSVGEQRADFEHIVMDGGSVDETRAIVDRFTGSYPVRMFSKPDRSLYEAVANGMRMSRGEIQGYLNCDDFYLPWTLATVSAIFESRPDVGWIVGLPSWFNEDKAIGRTIDYAPAYLRGLIRRGLYSPDRLGCIQQESVFWRRAVWDAGRAEDILLRYRYAADYHLWRRFAERESLYTVACVFACHSLSKTQLSYRFEGKYLEECGRSAKKFKPIAGAGLLNRVSAMLFRNLVIRPPALER